MSVRVTDFRNIVFFTGAGISAQSGIPTFRGKGGIWKEYDWENCACQGAFDRDPNYVWEFHNYRRDLVSKCDPNDGHHLIAQCEKVLPKVTIVTQNIDGLHQQAGSERVLELHGNLWKLRCDGCSWRTEDHSSPVEDLECPECIDRYKRPDIVWFGDNLNHRVVSRVASALGSCDLLVSIGTSAVVYPAADMPLIAKQAGATLVEINPEDTPISHAYDHCMRMSAIEGLTELCEGLPQAPAEA
ncbi:MAG: NAD-dependent deacylase [Myxococcota bacterium]